MALRRDHQVARRVRELVQQDECALASVHDEVLDADTRLVEAGSAIPNKDKVGKVTKAQLDEIVRLKGADLNARLVDHVEQYADKIKVADPSQTSTRYRNYVPFWA